MKPVPAPHRVMSDIQEAVLSYIDTAYWLATTPSCRGAATHSSPSPGPCSRSRCSSQCCRTRARSTRSRSVRSVGLTTEDRTRCSSSVFGDVGGARHEAARLTRRSPCVSRCWATGDARHPVVTSGTGSGKTESLPSAGARKAPARGASTGRRAERVNPWWEPSPNAGATRGTRRPAGGSGDRAVPDERARRGPDRPAAPHAAAHSAHWAGRRLWFGRYTGATLGRQPGCRERGRHRQLGEVAARAASAWSRSSTASLHAGEDLTAQMSDPRVAEMVTRWDMVAAPPDILVTNYSMLNVMLMRRSSSRCSARRASGSLRTRRTC